MNYRDLGNTGLRVSEIAIGCEGLVDKNGADMKVLLDMAEKEGINYIDFYNPDPAMRSLLGKCLLGRRHKFYLQAHLCAVWKNGQYERTRKIDEVKASFEDMLRLLQTDYIDVGFIHYCDSMKDWNEIESGPVMAYVQDMKQKGYIHHVGMSSHNPVVALAAVNSGLLDVLMFSINPCYDLQPPSEVVDDLWSEQAYAGELTNMDPDREKLYETCQRLGVGITVMKAYGGGDLLNEKYSPAGMALTVNQCLHYALTRPAVACIMTGAHSVQELQEAIAYETASPEERDYAAAFAKFPKIKWQGHCMYCGHCAPCPQHIDVAMVTKFLNLAKAQQNVPETVREHYAVLEHKASECIQCGACETRCPFGVDVRGNMGEAVQVFGE